MFGKLTLDAVPYHEPIIVVTVAAIIIGGLALLAAITYFGKWSYLWNEWLTSVDHKRLGIMYVIVAIVMLLPVGWPIRRSRELSTARASGSITGSGLSSYPVLVQRSPVLTSS